MSDNRVEARYRSEDMRDPVLLSTSEDVDNLVDALLAGPAAHDAALLLSRARPKLASGFWDHEFYVGVDRERQAGALVLATEEGRLSSVGAPDSRTDIAYHVAGHWTEFPDHSEIPIDLVRGALKEFLHSGGRIPTCIEWKAEETSGGDVDNDPWSD